MNTARVAIVGGGLAGLYAAYLLEQKGCHDYAVLEARDVLGGRISSIPVAARSSPADGAASVAHNRFDVGPTWFWPDIQPQLDRLVRELGLERFSQHETGDAMFERPGDESTVRTRGYTNSPASMRLVGGMAALTDALRSHIADARIFRGHTVRRIRKLDVIEVDTVDEAGQPMTWRVDHVLLAAPPRLVERTIEFAPALPEALARRWRATGTWMAPHAKYVAVYETAFWREQGLSGEARSARGPMAEIHDASMPGGSFGLFGFIGIPARARGDMPQDLLKLNCRAQLVRMFGPKAAAPQAECIKDWAFDRYTATAADIADGRGHDAAPPAGTGSGPWAGCLTGIGSEWSPRFPGYLAGAIEAADIGVQALLDRMSAQDE